MTISDKMAVLHQAKKAWQRRPKVLLCANTVKPMHGVVPRVILGREWWDSTRQEAYASTDFHCVACGVGKWEASEHRWLEGHELYETDYSIGRQVYVETVPLCHWCHCFVHDGRLEMLLRAGEITQQKFLDVMSHGRSILSVAGLPVVKMSYRGKMAKWEDWRLVLFGMEFPPLYETFEDWSKAFNPLKGD